MSREILFRGKTEQGKWVYGLLGCNYFRPNEKYYKIHNCETDDIEYEVIPETIGQFTGLTDKNGKKIFEGDIVRVKGKSGKSQTITQERVLQAYNDGITSPYEIAELCGVCVGYVYNILSQAKVKIQRPKRNYKQRKVCENTQAIITALRSGKRVREICAEFGVSTQYVYQVKNKFVKEQQDER